MILGVGSDIVSVARIRLALARHGERFARRILSPAEWTEFLHVRDQAAFLARRFAAKEAALKALGSGMRRGMSFQHFTVSHDRFGKPQWQLSDNAEQLRQALGIDRLHVSISDEHEFAFAVCIAEGTRPVSI